MIRKAKATDIERISEIYSKILDEEEAGRTNVGWKRGVYPTSETAIEALKRDDIFVEDIDGKIVATAIINKTQLPSYADCNWEYEADESEVMVLHTLVVDPDESGKGYAKEMLKFYEEYALDKECRYLRIDTQQQNQAARKMYAKQGFTEPGIVDCVFNGIPGVKLVCLEKKL